MHEQEHISPELVDEIRRYLAAVDLFRALGCEPTWRSELAAGLVVGDSVGARAGKPLSSDVSLH